MQQMWKRNRSRHRFLSGLRPSGKLGSNCRSSGADQFSIDDRQILFKGSVLEKSGGCRFRGIFPLSILSRVAALFSAVSIPCASAFALSCGSTPATYCLLHGDLAGVLRYNPICLPTLFFVVLPVFQDKWSVKPVIVRWYIVILVLFRICRNFPWYPFTFLAPPPGF